MQYYVLNTNFSNNPQNQEAMLWEQKAAAYIHGWKEKIDRLQKGDMVFLYQCGRGIIAYGWASGILETAPCGNETDGEHFQQLTAAEDSDARFGDEVGRRSRISVPHNHIFDQ